MTIRRIDTNETNRYSPDGIIPKEFRFDNDVQDSDDNTNELTVNNGQFSHVGAIIGETEGPSVNNGQTQSLKEVTERIKELIIGIPESKKTPKDPVHLEEGECATDLDPGMVGEGNAQGGYTQTANGLSDLLFGNGDIVRAILPHVTNTGALSLGNKALYRAVHYVEEQHEYQRLKRSLDFIFRQKGVLSEGQEHALQEILVEVKHTIECLLDKGPRVIPIGEDRVNRIKRAIAVVLSGTLKGAQKLPFPKGLEKLRMLINGDSSVVPLVRELECVAFAYVTLLGRCGEIDEFDPHLQEVGGRFEDIPGHYIQYVFDLLKTRQDIWAERILSCLSEIHKVLYERGDTTRAHLVYSKMSDLLEKYLSDQKLSMPSPITAISLGHMLLRERGPKAVVEMMYKLYPGILIRRVDICFDLIYAAASSEEYDLADSLADEYHVSQDSGLYIGDSLLREMHKMIEQMKERAQHHSAADNMV